MINKKEYITEKFIYFIIFGGTSGETEGQEWINDNNVIYSIRTVLREFAKHDHISIEMKERVYNILSELRSIKTDNYEERVELINDIIIILNSQTKDNSSELYNSEMQKRYRTIYPLDDTIVSEIDDSIAYDFVLLYMHNMNSDDFSQYIKDFSDYPRKYMMSINAILAGNPSILQEKNFFNNVMSVLNNIQENAKDFMTKRIVKKMKVILNKLG